MSNSQCNTNEKPYLITELITRYKQRLRTVYSNPNPYDKPLYEFSEIKNWIKKLQKITKQ